MGQVIAIANQKGGVGKTTTAATLGTALAERGKRVLLVDMDPQGALSATLGIDGDNLQTSIYNALMSLDVRLEDIIFEIRPGLHLIPSNIDLASAEMDLIPEIGRETILRDLLQPLAKGYDYTLIDTPPNLGLLTINVLTAADSVLIPIQCEFLAMRGMRLILMTINKIKAKHNPRLEILGILPTMFNARTVHAREVLQELRSVFGQKVFELVIRDSVKFAEAPVIHQTILEYAKNHEGAKAYRELAEVVIRGTKGKP